MTYWRRRFLALIVGLGVLSLIVWAFSGALGSGGAGHGAVAGGSHAPRGHGASAAASFRGSGPGSGSAAASASPSASAAAGQATQEGHGQDTQARAPASAPGRVVACKPGDVVLSLFSSQDRYGQGQPPKFDVDVVSTSARTCAFNVGPAQLSLVVRASGKRVWGSADCVAGSGALPADLARGVPAIVPISWDLRTSARGCRGTSGRAPAGSYMAEASDGQIASNQVRFTVGPAS